MKSQSVRYRGTKVGRKQKQVITANVDLKHLVDGLKEAQDGEWYDGEDSRLLKQIKLAKALDKSDRVQDAHAAYVPPAGAPVIQRESPVVHDAVLPPVVRQKTFSVAELEEQRRDNARNSGLNMATAAKELRAHRRGVWPVMVSEATRVAKQRQEELDDLIEQQKIDIPYRQSIGDLKAFVAMEGGIELQSDEVRAILDRAKPKKKKKRKRPPIEDDHGDGPDDSGDDDDDGDGSRALNKKQKATIPNIDTVRRARMAALNRQKPMGTMNGVRADNIAPSADAQVVMASSSSSSSSSAAAAASR
jgi:hypothetical protein